MTRRDLWRLLGVLSAATLVPVGCSQARPRATSLAPAETPTEPPTDTPEPAETPMEPTSTPVPTDTPVPTATPRPTETPLAPTPTASPVAPTLEQGRITFAETGS